jgi:hypothetical protein
MQQMAVLLLLSHKFTWPPCWYCWSWDVDHYQECMIYNAMMFTPTSMSGGVYNISRNVYGMDQWMDGWAVMSVDGWMNEQKHKHILKRIPRKRTTLIFYTPKHMIHHMQTVISALVLKNIHTFILHPTDNCLVQETETVLLSLISSCLSDICSHKK